MLVGTKQLKLWGGTLAKFAFVLVSGKAGVGKTTFSRYLQEALESDGYIVTLQAFASPIKEIARNYMGWDGKKDEKGRWLLQHLGTEVGRVYDKDVWVKYLFNKIQNKLVHPDFVIVDDWRYPNEADYLKQFELYDLVKIRIESEERSALKGEAANHVSELSLPSAEENPDYYNFVVCNCKIDLKGVRELAFKTADILLSKERRIE